MRRDCNHIPCRLPDCSCKIEPEGLEYVESVNVQDDTDSKNDFTEGKEYESQNGLELLEHYNRGNLYYAVPKESRLGSILESVLNTLAGRNRTGKILGRVKDVLSLFVPYGGKIDHSTDLVGNLLFKPKRNKQKVMNDSKPWYKSVTVNSIIVIIVILTGQFFDIELTEAELQGTIEAVGVALASVTALWGRIRAQAQIASK